MRKAENHAFICKPCRAKFWSRETYEAHKKEYHQIDRKPAWWRGKNKKQTQETDNGES